MTQHLYRKQHVVTSVVAVIVDDAEQVLLTRRAIPPFLDMWVMPGGKIDLGEPILRALHREEHLTPDTDHFVILYYRCRPLTHALMPNPAEVAEARWVARAELPSLSMTDGSRFILGKLFPELPASMPRVGSGDGESGEG
jgi:8-oxo-dGTP diphosphatase